MTVNNWSRFVYDYVEEVQRLTGVLPKDQWWDRTDIDAFRTRIVKIRDSVAKEYGYDPTEIAVPELSVGCGAVIITFPHQYTVTYQAESKRGLKIEEGVYVSPEKC